MCCTRSSTVPPRILLRYPLLRPIWRSSDWRERPATRTTVASTLRSRCTSCSRGSVMTAYDSTLCRRIGRFCRHSGLPRLIVPGELVVVGLGGRQRPPDRAVDRRGGLQLLFDGPPHFEAVRQGLRIAARHLHQLVE